MRASQSLNCWVSAALIFAHPGVQTLDALLKNSTTTSTLSQFAAIQRDTPALTPFRLRDEQKRPGGGASQLDLVVSRGGGQPTRPSVRDVTVTIEAPTGDLGGLDREVVDHTVRMRAGIYRACYQRELNRVLDLRGKMTVLFKVGPEGTVKVARVTSATLTNVAVTQCILANVMRLRFPAGADATLHVQFTFAPGG